MKHRLHIFTDGGFSARALVTRPTEHYLLDVWASDISQFSPEIPLTETTANFWLSRIVTGICRTGVPCELVVRAPNTCEQRYLLVP